ncbi:fumarylacetoacetate hydrolase family protein [Accumulibacter sp.]|uniref:fumarylacetoacetate hydrolase family protein n=1 Tax=Accumulibacter sp. TaxID=2053492 RepID=UPI0025E2D9F4|nr:fumarylacetoacetate hydrolase family protein [Accumulibacter sp.]MCM8613584.1 fumarylacetoacetate hydrolase family protein [Accumulibacter sp.]MCM8637233.1 fumarylacetoacetate hydrolase family protein [Accumulibacter sp.]MCM8638157.1 fumarylacetoacetate hydrolase family protein [Accumulibacter sp.]
MTYVFPPPPRVALPVIGNDALFPVRRVYCVGRNYADHAVEMGADSREPPFFFSKPPDALVAGGGDVPYPPLTGNLQHEVELVVALAAGGAQIPVARALDCVFGYAVGLDLTRRDVQQRAKDKGHPWDMAKGFDHSAPIGAIVPLTASGHPAQGAIQLRVNGQLRQNGDLGQMSWKVAEVIANLSTHVRLEAGDLIFTGTPAGVSTVARGDLLEAVVAGVGELTVRLI